MAGAVDARADLCAATIKGVLAQYGCMVVTTPFIREDGTISAETHIVVKPE
jgi:hypothetical protein